jgi:hypothetical protein
VASAAFANQIRGIRRLREIHPGTNTDISTKKSKKIPAIRVLSSLLHAPFTQFVFSVTLFPANA